MKYGFALIFGLLTIGVVIQGYCLPIALSEQQEIIWHGAGVDTLYTLPDRWINAQSLAVQVDSVLWQLNVHYWVEPPGNLLRFYRIIEPSETIRVTYRQLPFSLQNSYYHRDLSSVAVVLDTGKTTEVVLPTGQSRSSTPAFGSELRRSGSLVRGITVGTGQDLEIQSGMQLQIEGKVGTNIDVMAVLSDQNTPIQPEGTTETLEEVDKVYVEVASSQMRATLGDFQLYLPGHRWGTYSRKLTGARGEGWTDWGKITLTGAVSEGEFHTNSFYGQEGNQGPYRLIGKDGETGIRVLAGTEHVWVDGQTMVRGDTRDYVIEYGNGEITFTSNRLITGNSRILVDFEYAPESYRRSYYSAQSEATVGDSLLTVTGTFLFEGDDPNSPLGLSLTQQDRQALSAAGDQEGGAWVSGVDSAGPGNGFYVYADTIFNDTTYWYLKFVGRDSLEQPLGYLNVLFTQFSSDSSAYIRTYNSLGELFYQWVGPGNGLYIPYRRLTAPQQHTLSDVSLELRPWKRCNVVGELATSDLDRNLLSPLDENDNRGWAGEISFDINREPINVSDHSLGWMTMHGEYRRKDNRFSELSRSGLVEYNRYWGLQGDESPGEEVAEGNATYEPINGVSMTGGYGRMNRDDVNSERKNGSVQLLFPQKFEGQLSQEWIDTRYPETDQSSAFIHRDGHATYHYRIWHPLVFHRYEEEETRGDSTVGSRFNENGGGLGIGTLWGMFLSTDVGLRQDQVLEQTYYRDLSDTWTSNIGWKGDWGTTFHGDANYTHRVRYFVQSDSPDVTTDLGTLTASSSPWNSVLSSQLNYRLSNSRVARLAIVAIQVEPGTGDYIQQGGVYVPDDEGNFRLETVPTGDYDPVTELTTGITLRVQPERLPPTTQKRLGILPRLSTETQFDIQEQSRWHDLWDIVTYRPGVIQGDSTLYGRLNLRQDLNWDRTKVHFSARLRGRLMQSLNRTYQLNAETITIHEGSLWMRRKLSDQISGEWETTVKSEQREYTGAGRIDRDIQRQTSRIDVSYRWAQPHELGLGLGVIHGEDLAGDQRFWASEIEPSFTESLREKGRLDFSVKWNHVVTDNTTLSYELSEGLSPGDNLHWSARAMLNLGKNLTGSVSYEGRMEPGQPVRHTGQMEIRAYF